MAMRCDRRICRNFPRTLEVIGEIKAGEKLDRIPANIGSGQAVAIMTGAPVPAGADAVVMVEYTTRAWRHASRSRGALLPARTLFPAARRRGKGSVLVDRGDRLTEAAIALAASVGKVAFAGVPAPASRGAHHR